MKILKLLFLALFIVYPFGQLTRLPLVIPSVNVYPHDLIIVLILIAWLGWHILKKEKVKLPPLGKPILGFVAVAFFSWILAIPQHRLMESFVAFCYFLRWTAYAGIYFVVYKETPRLIGLLTNGLLVAGIASAIFGLLQYVFLPDTRFLYYSGWDDHYFRVIAPFLDPGFTGMIYVLVLILLINVYWENFLKKKSLFTICYLALILTYSRASYLAYIVAMAVIAFQKKSPKFLAIILGLFLLTVLLLPRPSSEGVKLERKTSAIARVSNWQNALKIIRDHPFFGVGFNFYRYAQRDYGLLGKNWQTSHSDAGADSSLLFVWATSGAIGLVFYFWLLAEMAKIAPCATLALVVHSFFNNSLFYPWIMLWMWIFLGTRECKKQ